MDAIDDQQPNPSPNTSGFANMREIYEFVVACGYSFSSTVALDGTTTTSLIAPKKESREVVSDQRWSEYLDMLRAAILKEPAQ